MTDRRSLVPRYVFPETLAEQQEALAANPLMQRLHRAREGYVGDRHRPVYHYVNPEAMLNDPQWVVLLAGAVASVLSGVSAGGYAAALGGTL